MSEPPSLAQLRIERAWTQAQLASQSRVSRTEISAIETGRLVPSVAVALKLAAALGVTVEAIFGAARESDLIDWAWRPRAPGDPRVWRASIGGRQYTYPVEPTAAGAIAHDASVDRQGSRGVTAPPPPDRTLVVAGCDPLVGLLAREVAARHDVRVLPLLRSSGRALDLLKQGLVHVAGLHLGDASGQSLNDSIVRETLGTGYRLVHQLQWDAGIAVVACRRERTAAALLRANVRWVNREEGSSARRAFDLLLSSRRRPAGYDHVVGDHRAVAATVSSGWAEAGICVRPAAAEALLPFIPLHREAYELCVSESHLDDPRIAALIATLQSAHYRRLVADVPGCASRETGNVRTVA